MFANALPKRGAGHDALPACLGRENPHRLVSLWWVMHRSDEESRQVAVVTFYLDESGTHEGSAIAVVGGLLLNKEGFRALDDTWREILARHSILPPLHMKEFRRPDGRLADVSNDQRRALFSDVVKVINENKIYSIAASLTPDRFKKYFDKTFRRETMSVYGMCFILCAHRNYLRTQQNHYDENIPFLMDSGNQYAEHVRAAHAAMQEDQWKTMRVGSLTFDKDEDWSPLQAADVIAWASRTRVQRGSFDNGYEPLAGLFDKAHDQQGYLEDVFADLAMSLEAFRQTGKMPSVPS
jgi:hypothetical protein